ncbi:MAG TPA: hypothetical protein VGD16_11075, partial [Enterovirga sp.]
MAAYAAAFSFPDLIDMRAEFVAAPAGGPPLGLGLGAYAATATRPDQAPQSAALRWTRRQWAGALVAVLAFWAAAALVWPLTNSVVPWDSKNHFYPMLRY